MAFFVVLIIIIALAVWVVGLYRTPSRRSKCSSSGATT
jgi:hypothetical protein